MGFEFPVVDRKYGAGDTVPLRTRVNSVTNMSAEVVAFACLDRVIAVLTAAAASSSLPRLPYHHHHRSNNPPSSPYPHLIIHINIY
ncbi:hypothetical protein NC651_020019 [Populus alba x Populus x berolinensis]|nr:hypothetical protein NC651_020019 [Populus alba x Populus x berolinensis]